MWCGEYDRIEWYDNQIVDRRLISDFVEMAMMDVQLSIQIIHSDSSKSDPL